VDDDITPDTKDWTWVLERPCPECGLDTRELGHDDISRLLRANAAAWSRPLHDSAARERPAPGVWSPVEYACHVRDVFRLYDERLAMMVERDDPAYPNWDQDETAVEGDYRSQDPKQVESELQLAGEQIAANFDVMTEEQWLRTGRRSDGVSFTIDSFARYLVHDVMHHLHDVGAEQPR
jgi:hypothetical protein